MIDELRGAARAREPGQPTLSAVDPALPGPADPLRIELRAWLEQHPSPTPRQLAERGLVAPHWPEPYGLGADPTRQLVVDDELRRAGVRRPDNPIGIGWAGPTLLHAGSEEQKQRYLVPLLAGEEIWCQLFSEPDAGSDLASLTTRAEPDGDEWIVRGRKVWTSYAHRAHYGILLARTEHDVPAHQSISYFVCPMDAAGIEVRPLTDMTGTHTFNEVLLDDVRLPPGSLVGERGQGWALAKVTLANERVSLSTGGALWGMGPTMDDLTDAVRATGGVGDALMRQRMAEVCSEAEVLRLLRLRMVAAAIAGDVPGPETSVRKALADEHGQHLMAVARSLAGARGRLAEAGPDGGSWPDAGWSYGFLFAPALTIGGGTAEVQRNIIAERTLGLPRDLPGE